MGVTFRPLRPEDVAPARLALETSGAFNGEEIAVAIDMISAGLAGHYELLAIEGEGEFAGYACFGRAALSQGGWYLYWICVGTKFRNRGLGRKLEAALARRVANLGGSMIVVETSGREDYAHVRRFYEGAGYSVSGRLPDFYAKGDDCVIYSRRIAP